MHKKLTAAALTLGLTFAGAGTALASPSLAAQKPPTPPAGTKAAPRTPDVAALAGALATQEIVWGPCDFGDPELNAMFPGGECATITVPRDWHNPGDGNTFEIAISRIVTVDTDSPAYRGTLFINPGGPGGEGRVMPHAISPLLPELHGSYNFVGFDPRGVGQSTHAVCDLPGEAVAAATDQQEVNRLIASCQDQPGVRQINTEQTVYDMDLLRHLLGLPKLSYLGYSYGTWLGAWYGAVFGPHADRFVLDSNTGLTDTTLERTFEIQATARDRQFEEHLMNWTARHDDVYGLGTVPSAIHARYVHAQEVLGDELTGFIWVLTGGYSAFPANSQYPIGAATVQVIVEIAGMVESGEIDLGADESAPEVAARLGVALDRLDAGASPQARTAHDDLRAALAQNVADAPETPADEEIPETVQVDEPFLWVTCQDGQFDTNVQRQEAEARQRSADNPVSRALGTADALPCMYFRTDLAKPAPGREFPTSMLLQAELDSQTAWELGVDAGRAMPNSAFLAVDNEGSHAFFPYGLSTVDRPVLNLLLDGTLPKKDIVAQAKPLPGDSTTWESWQRLNPTARHAGPNRDDAWQPIKTQGNGHPTLPPEGLPVSELLVEIQGADPAVETAQELRRLTELGR